MQIGELTYINLIESCDYWQDAQDTANIFPGFRMVAQGDAQAIDFNHVTVQRHASDLSVTIGIRTARSAQDDPPKTVLIFEFRALGLLGVAGKAEADAWFARAHDTIGNCFTNVTNPDIQRRYWQPL